MTLLKKAFFLCFILLISNICFAESEKNEPIIYGVMNQFKLPYIHQCEADPEVVQEYLLVMEIDYLTWLKKSILQRNDGDIENYGESIRFILNNKIKELTEFQKSCVSSSKE